MMICDFSVTVLFLAVFFCTLDAGVFHHPEQRRFRHDRRSTYRRLLLTMNNFYWTVNIAQVFISPDWEFHNQ